MAARKVRTLVAAGALVTVVAPEVDPAIESMTAVADPGAVGTVTAVEHRPYRSGEAAGFDLVVTATGDPTVDDAVVADGRSAGVLVNGAGRGGPGPSASRRSSAGARSPWPSPPGDQPGPGPVAAGPARRLPPAGLDTVAGLLDETRAELQATGRPTDAVAVGPAPRRQCCPWWRPAGSTRPGRRSGPPSGPPGRAPGSRHLGPGPDPSVR